MHQDLDALAARNYAFEQKARNLGFCSESLVGIINEMSGRATAEPSAPTETGAFVQGNGTAAPEATAATGQGESLACCQGGAG